ncbi:MAG: hypothetical protein KBS68_04505 [Clostridiales bacterium]|nr:hypothetical protein [Candidatus Crickella merdequi]
MRGKINFGTVSLEQAHSILGEMLSRGIVADVKMNVDIVEGQIKFEPEGFQQVTLNETWGEE